MKVYFLFYLGGKINKVKVAFIARKQDILLDNVLKTKEKETIEISGKIIECQDSTLKKGNTRDTLMKNLFVRKDMSEMIEIEGNIVEMTSEKGEMTEIEEMKDKEEGDTKIIDMTNI